jgi:1,2-dihydroxy-3-keto-5-methylthiopentene dioxygenase
MSLLTIYQNADRGKSRVIRDPAEISRQLNTIGVHFERWSASEPLADNADQAAVLEAYKVQVAELMQKHGFKSADVISVRPDFPERVALRQKFLSEHTHSEFEVRFFVDGHGLFCLHPDENVYAVYCEKGDLLSVPAGMKHWFDSGAEPNIKAIRLFTTTEGWVAQYTGDKIADTLPKMEDLPRHASHTVIPDSA